jgi:hypothetical protein
MAATAICVVIVAVDAGASTAEEGATRTGDAGAACGPAAGVMTAWGTIAVVRFSIWTTGEEDGAARCTAGDAGATWGAVAGVVAAWGMEVAAQFAGAAVAVSVVVVADGDA